MPTTSVLAFISRYRHYTILFLSIFGFLSFGLYHVGSFITADEHYWVEERIPQYWNAWSNGNLKKTYINDKPGISLALVSGIALPFLDQSTVACQYEEGRFHNCDPTKTTTIYRTFRIPILILNAILLIALFFSVRAFSSLLVANATVFFTALSPHLVGMSQIINPDALLWSTGSIALFSFIALLKTGKWRFFFLSSVTLALALLSKYTALIILFFLPVFVLILYFTDRNFSTIRLKYQTLITLFVPISALILFFLFFPGILSSYTKFFTYFTAGTFSILPWVGYAALIFCLTILSFFKSPQKLEISLAYLAQNTLRIVAVAFLVLSSITIITRLVFPEWAIFSTIPNDIKDLTNARYYISRFLTPFEISMIELSALIYSLPIISLLLALFTLIAATFTRKKHFQSPPLCILFFIILNLAALGCSNVFGVSRYVILLFPMIAYLAAEGLGDMLSKIPRYNMRYAPSITMVTIILVGGISVASLISTTPYYANFSNLLLPDNALQDHGWGYGGYEAAQYLNSLPNAKDLTIWSDYYGSCEFFIGRCLTAYSFKENERNPSYYILTKRGESRYMPRFDRWEAKSGLIAHQYYDRPNPDFEISINGKKENFVKVYKIEYPN